MGPYRVFDIAKGHRLLCMWFVGPGRNALGMRFNGARRCNPPEDCDCVDRLAEDGRV